ncbi:hypothetical protein [Streptomyces sp. NPDC056160]|uniref:hypothetical protein n=1 Tax=Streptomyces sp. NPDC056160 TaxID=3345731 RepID=UPI0035D85094
MGTTSAPARCAIPSLSTSMGHAMATATIPCGADHSGLAPSSASGRAPTCAERSA